MSRVHQELTPLEKRARRIRMTVTTIFAVFCVAIAFSTAYFGAQLAKKNPPLLIHFNSNSNLVIGQLFFNTEEELARLRSILDIEDITEEIDLSEFNLIAPAFPKQGVALFLFDEVTGEQLHWALWLPFIRKNRLYLDRMQKSLNESPQLVTFEIADHHQEEYLAKYRMLNNGLLIASSNFPVELTGTATFSEWPERSVEYQVPGKHFPSHLKNWEAFAQSATTTTTGAALVIRWGDIRSEDQPVTINLGQETLQVIQRQDDNWRPPLLNPSDFVGIRQNG